MDGKAFGEGINLLMKALFVGGCLAGIVGTAVVGGLLYWCCG